MKAIVAETSDLQMNAVTLIVTMTTAICTFFIVSFSLDQNLMLTRGVSDITGCALFLIITCLSTP